MNILNEDSICSWEIIHTYTQHYQVKKTTAVCLSTVFGWHHISVAGANKTSFKLLLFIMVLSVFCAV